ncbi:hypothetical protein B0H16DRAFT_1880958 [Mycena metata]|uniref:Uncharacterized protein n=1 Tax=Mycena metata TaxID=1033252 RepID=A0AAD7JUV1_9AGAR|nr:hypothetical protein B0H16DRAFT_1880958 [Mycena metata]
MPALRELPSAASIVYFLIGAPLAGLCAIMLMGIWELFKINYNGRKPWGGFPLSQMPIMTSGTPDATKSEILAVNNPNGRTLHKLGSATFLI